MSEAKKETAEEKEVKQKEARKKYNNTFATQIAIWDVLARYSSREHPLGISDICRLLKGENAPAVHTVQRFFAGHEAKALMDTVIPTHTLMETGTPGASHAYVHKNALHVVLEDREGLAEWEGDVTAVFETGTPIVPRASSVAHLLGSYPENGSPQSPVRLKCMVAETQSGKVTYIPYERWARRFTGDADPPKTKRYYYLESVLSKAEWKILADAVKVYPYITQKQTAKLLSALRRMNPSKDNAAYYLDNRYAFKRERSKDFQDFFKIVDILDTAIRERNTVVVVYGAYVLEQSAEGRWEPVLKKRENRHGQYGNWEIQPYDLMWSNGYYYLVGKNRQDSWMNLRVDRILTVVPLAEQFERMDGFSPAEYRDRSPVMYPGKEQLIRLRCKEDMLNTLLDFFGAKLTFRKPQDGLIEAAVNVAPEGVKLFAMQYAGRVEVLEPEELREAVRDSLRSALEAYQ